MDIELLIETLAHGGPVVVLSGSGISAESGVPTFRDAQKGLWARFAPEALATPEAFAANPTRVWRWYARRRELALRAQPNPAHIALARWQQACDDVTLITQNVDGLHQRAGSPTVIEFHGNLNSNRCSLEGRELRDDEWAPGEPPTCLLCGEPVRPGVVWFGERIPDDARHAASRATATCTAFLSVGTSSLVWPAASYAERALSNGATVVEINPEETSLSPHAHHRFAAAAGDVLPDLVAQVLRARAASSG